MSVSPKCPSCGAIERPLSVEQEHHRTTLLVLYCAVCGSILAAADLHPNYPTFGGLFARDASAR